MDRILELPQGAADTAPIPVTGPQSLITEWFGKYTRYHIDDIVITGN